MCGGCRGKLLSGSELHVVISIFLRKENVTLKTYNGLLFVLFFLRILQDKKSFNITIIFVLLY